jgi:hypothetical protein
MSKKENGIDRVVKPGIEEHAENDEEPEVFHGPGFRCRGLRHGGLSVDWL